MFKNFRGHFIILLPAVLSACSTTSRREVAWELHHTGRIESVQNVEVTEYPSYKFDVLVVGKAIVPVAAGRSKIAAYKYFIRTKNSEVIEVEVKDSYAVGTCVDVIGLETDPGGLRYSYQMSLLRASERCIN